MTFSPRRASQPDVGIPARGTIDEKTAEYLQGLLKLPHIGSRGLDALYQEVKKQGKAYNAKLKSGLTLENIKE